MTYELLQVGKPHPTLRPPLGEGAHFSWTREALELLLSFRRPSRQEIEDARHGAAEFALAALPETPDVVWLCWRLGKSLPWSDAPYTIHRVPEAHRPDNLVLATEATRLAMQVLLVDASTAIVQAIRLVTISPEMSRELAVRVLAQAGRAWVGDAAYEAQISRAYAKYQSAGMLAHTVARTMGGA